MKKIIIAFVLLACSVVSAKAQKLNFALEGSFGKGTQFIVMDGGASFVAGYKINNALERHTRSRKWMEIQKPAR